MSNVIINEANLTAIGNAIREKNGTETKYKPKDMAAAILNIQGGGGNLPEEAFTITGDLSYRFSNNGWNWYINHFGKNINTQGITNFQSCFYKSTQLTSIPFDLRVSNCSLFSYLFSNCEKLEAVPSIVGENSTTADINFGYMFEKCRKLKEIPNDYFTGMGGESFQAQITERASAQNLFDSCHSLRVLPDLKPFNDTYCTVYGSLYYNGFNNCYALDEIVNLPVVGNFNNWSSNSFYNTFKYCGRVKDVTFATNEDGSVKRVNWMYQVIDLSQNVGYEPNTYYITNWNSGLTSATEVTDDTTYNALKDNPDWWTTKKEYSRYNKEAALRTLRSLPDATSGVQNTIKFDSESGRNTDGGAIVELTELDYVIAAEKGWTITLM